MLIKELSIANFRGIREGKLSDLAQVNILVGRNNSGKSSVLEALSLIAQIGKDKPHKEVPGRDPLNREMPSHLFSRRVARRSNYWDELHFGFKRDNTIAIRTVFNGGINVMLTGYDVRLPTTHAHLEGGSSKEHEWLGRAVLVDAFLARDFGAIESQLWQRIKADRRDRELKQVVAEAYGMEIDNLSFIPFDGSYKLAVETQVRSIPVDSIGDGLRHALAVLSVAVVAKDSALMLEELETHQHPESLQKLLLALFKMAKRNNIQLFMSTHSLELIAYALEAAEKEELGLKLFHLSLSTDGLLTARGIPAPDAKVLADIGPDPRMLDKYASLKSK